MKKVIRSLTAILLFITCLSSISQESGNTQLRLGDRIFVTRTLKAIFGQASDRIISQGIFNKFHIFGAPCDPYSQYLKPTKEGYTVEGSYQKCHQKFFLEYRTPILVPSSPLRSGAMIKTCQQLVKCNACFNHALRKAGINGSESFNLEQSSKKLYRLFYPFRNEEEWQSLLNSLMDNPEYWNSKKVLRLFCMSEGWQTL
ncbi:MAG: hypothetical protein NXH75_03500 [Halobacteriovoraceae bacterium]|nr:hypothetical protein [Halobacteriovoraceae bacterium]